MILGEVEETLTTVEIDDETYEEIIKARSPVLNPYTLNRQDMLPCAGCGSHLSLEISSINPAIPALRFNCFRAILKVHVLLN